MFLDWRNQYCQSDYTMTVHRFSAVVIKLNSIFTEPEKIFKKFVGRHRIPQRAKTRLRKKNEAGGIGLPDLIIYHATVKNSMILVQKQKYRWMQQEKSKNKPMYLCQLLIYKNEE